jgi:hypothetical protein
MAATVKGQCQAKSPIGQTRNPKPEIRMKSQTQNPKAARALHLGFWFWSFIRVSGFGFLVLRRPFFVLHSAFIVLRFPAVLIS